MSVDDPYRYMEDLEDPEVQRWIKGQAEYAAEVLGKIPGRSELLERLRELDAGKPFSTSNIRRFKDGTLFYQKRAADENIPKLYVHYAGSAEERLLVDPEQMTSDDGQHFSMGFYTPSPDRRYVAYGLAKGGSEETVLHILDIRSGKDLPETIDRIEPYYNRPRWLPDGNGFFYTRLQDLPADAPEIEIYKKARAYFHRLGTPAEDDIEVMGYGLSERVPLDEIDFPSIYTPYGSGYAVAKIHHGDARELAFYTAPMRTLLEGDIPWVEVCTAEDEVTDLAVHRNDIYLQTAKDAPRFKVVRTALGAPAPSILSRRDIPPKHVSPDRAAARAAS